MHLLCLQQLHQASCAASLKIRNLAPQPCKEDGRWYLPHSGQKQQVLNRDNHWKISSLSWPQPPAKYGSGGFLEVSSLSSAKYAPSNRGVPCWEFRNAGGWCVRETSHQAVSRDAWYYAGLLIPKVVFVGDSPSWAVASHSQSRDHVLNPALRDADNMGRGSKYMQTHSSGCFWCCLEPSVRSAAPRRVHALHHG